MTKETTSVGKGGILMPLMKFRFRVVFGGEHIYDEQCILTQQVMNCSIDMKEKTFSINLRQPCVPNMITMLNLVINGYYNIYVEPLDSANDAAHFSIELYGCKCINHKFDLDYADSDVATHELAFSYHSLREIEPVDWQTLADEVKNPKK